MGIAIYIAAAAVIGILIGLTALSIGFLQETVKKNIRSRTLDLISIYDTALEEKSAQLKKLEAEVNALQQTVSQESVLAENRAAATDRGAGMAAGSVLNAVERMSTVAYRNNAAADLYSSIKSNFTFDPESLIQGLSGAEGKPGPASRLLEKLGYDAVYELTSLTSEQQLAVLREVLPEDGTDLLDEYLQDGKEFRVLPFYDYLKAKAWEEPQPTRLRVNSTMAAAIPQSEKIEVIIDNGICEGFQIEEHHILHDYSIRSREIS